MKRAVAFLLLILFLFNFCGYYILFLVLKSDIHKEMQLHLAYDQTEILHIHKQDKNLVWIDKNEFDYKGKRYDVAEIHEKNDYLIIHCIEDTLEAELIAGLERYLKKQHGHDSKTKTKKQVVKKINSLYANLKTVAWEADDEGHENLFSNPTPHVCSVTLPVAAPPPDDTTSLS